MPKTFIPLRTRLTVHLRSLKLHRFIAPDPATAAVTVERFPGRANTSLARRIIKEVRRAITACFTLPLLGQVPGTVALGRGKARVGWADEGSPTYHRSP